MTNWHALPFELKTLVLKAYIDCIMHEKRDYDWTIYHSALVCITSASPAHQHPRPAECGLATLSLVAPELQLEALGLVNMKLRGATMLDVVWRLEGTKWESCMWSIMRRQLACDVPLEEARGHTAEYTAFCYPGLGVKSVNQQIKAASAEYRQYSLRSIDRNLALGRSGLQSSVVHKRNGYGNVSMIRCVRT